jgi:hypothetical protein
MKAPVAMLVLVSAMLGYPTSAFSAAGDEVTVSRESIVGGIRVVLLAVSREVVLTGEKSPDKAFRHRLRITFLVERLEEPKQSVALNLGELQTFLAGTDKRADDGANLFYMKAYTLDNYPYRNRVPIPKVKNKEWASIYERDSEPLRRIEGRAIDFRIKGAGLGEKVGNCEFRNIPLE